MSDEPAGTGLRTDEATRRRDRYGANVLPPSGRRPALHILWRQVASPLVLVLIVAAGIARALGETTESVVILAIVLLNALLGFTQEYRADRTLRALGALVTRQARVRRDGAWRDLPAADLVPGDLVQLEMGDRVPADVMLQTSDGCAFDEAVLTGESAPVPRAAGEVAPMGAVVASGSALAEVTATGLATTLGRAARALTHASAPSEFERGLAQFSGFLVRVILLLTVFVFAVNALAGKGTFDAFLFALALAVGITPEVLPVIVTIALARGARRLARDEVVVKQLSAVEDLGNIDVLCSDKTGTLTEGAFVLDDAVAAAGTTRDDVLWAAAVTAVATTGRPESPADNATDRAIWQAPALDAVRDRLAASAVEARLPFDFQRRLAAVQVRDGDRRQLVVKGALEAVLACCVLDETQRAALIAGAAASERDGLRVLAVAVGEVAVGDVAVGDVRGVAASRGDAADATAAGDDAITTVTADRLVGLTLCGLLRFRDPPKEEARAALDALEALGVTVKIISGDSAEVTRRTCHDVDCPIPEDRILLGADLEAMDDAALAEAAVRYGVFSRVGPEQKARLVAALRAQGRVVAFLGDGVNDAPALRAADVGVAVDTGADVAKDAADIVLLRKGLDVLADGILEGRRTFANITKYISNTVSANFGNMGTVAVSSLFLPFIPLLPSQILLNNFLSDLPLATIATDRVDAALTRRPRHWDIRAIARFMVVFGLISACFDLALIVPMLTLFGTDMATFRTAWFVESACSEMLVTFAIRTTHPLWRSRPGTLLLAASAAGVAIAFTVPYVPVAQALFGFVPLPAPLLGYVVLLLASYVATAELAKRWFYRAERRVEG